MAVRVRVVGSERALDAEPGDSLLALLQRHAHPIATACGGVASCGLCRLTVVSGQQLLSPLKPEEVHHLGNVAKLISARLACQSVVADAEGEITVEVPAVEDSNARQLRKNERARADRRARDAPRASERNLAATAGTIEWRPRKLQGRG